MEKPKAEERIDVWDGSLKIDGLPTDWKEAFLLTPWLESPDSTL